MGEMRGETRDKEERETRREKKAEWEERGRGAEEKR